MRIKYKVLTQTGALEEKTVDVENRYDLMSSLREAGLMIIDLHEEEQVAAVPGKAWKLEFFSVSRNTIAFFTRQFSELIDAGIPLVEALQSVARFSPNAKMCAVITDLIDGIQRGENLSTAMERHPAVFNPLYQSLVKVGETTGNLPAMLTRLADYLERDMEVRGKVKAALTYPCFILIFSLVLVYLMVSWLLPSFEPMWHSSGVSLDHYPITQMLMRVSALTHNIWDEVLVTTGVVMLAYGYMVYVHTPAGGRRVDGLFMRVPIVGNFLVLTIMARVSSTMATLLDSGADLLQALQMAAGVAGNRVVSDALLAVSREVASGGKLGDAVKKHHDVFPELMLQMISLGEQSGQLSKMLPRVARYYESQLDAAVKAFSSLIEPIMMTIVGGIVFTFVLGVMMPIMGIVAALQQHM